MGRIRIDFTREEPVRWISHLDIQKTFQRSLRRAQVPLAYSEGFNPHPLLSFASAMSVGLISLGEYLDIEVTEEVDVPQMVERLQRALPEGFRVIDAKTIPDKTPALMAVINRACYRIKARTTGPMTETQLSEAIEQVLLQKEILVDRKGKKGVSRKDIRAGIFELKGKLVDDAILLETTVLTGSDGNVRPEEILKALAETGSLPVNIEHPRTTRIGLYVDTNGELKTPLEVAM